jgi:serine/threonine protein kinase
MLDTDQDLINTKLGDFDEEAIKWIRTIEFPERNTTIDHVKHRGLTLARKKMTIESGSSNLSRQVAKWFDELKVCVSPYLVDIYRARLRLDNKITLYTEFMGCLSLLDITKRMNRIPERTLGRFVEPVLLGLVYLNEEKCMPHGNLKSSNILLNAKGQIKLCDFGTVREFGGERRRENPVYLSPESWTYYGEIESSAHSDTWSLGIVLIECAIGRCPFPASTEDELDTLFRIDPRGFKPRDTRWKCKKF